MLVGSCFSENIAQKLSYYKFNVFSNPFGILFNPIAIENLIYNAVNEKVYTENDIFFHNERWHCFDAHSALSNNQKSKLLSNLNGALANTLDQLKLATHLIFTLGTAWVYRFIETDTIVGNCHKVPQKKFIKELLSVDDILGSLQKCCALIKEINPNCAIVFTVSPVRHLKDGFTENSLSKAHLISAIHQIIEKENNLFYFPSFEIMMDDLRDYRFYATDMIHPNETAINYIWEIFVETWFSKNVLTIMDKADSIQKALAHKPFNPTSQQHIDFLKSLQTKIQNLKEKYNIEF
jgi:hypothetical protein